MRDRSSQGGRETESDGRSPSGTATSWREQIFHTAQGTNIVCYLLDLERQCCSCL